MVDCKLIKIPNKYQLQYTFRQKFKQSRKRSMKYVYVLLLLKAIS